MTIEMNKKKTNITDINDEWSSSAMKYTISVIKSDSPITTGINFTHTFSIYVPFGNHKET
jgi:hypothetical protein